jgi:hypothetical protein
VADVIKPFLQTVPFPVEIIWCPQELGSVAYVLQDLFYSFHCVKGYIFFPPEIVCILLKESGEGLFLTKNKKESCKTDQNLAM